MVLSLSGFHPHPLNTALRIGESMVVKNSSKTMDTFSSLALELVNQQQHSFVSYLYVLSGLNSHYFHIIGDKLINPSP